MIKKDFNNSMPINETIGLGFVGGASLGSLGYLGFNPEIVHQVLIFSFVLLIVYWLIYKKLESVGFGSYLITISGMVSLIIGFFYLFKDGFLPIIGFIYLISTIIGLKLHLEGVYYSERT